MVFTQLYRHLAFASPLGEDVLLLKALRGQEGISRLFHFDLELVSENPSIDFAAIVGKNVTVKIRLADQLTDRYINGVVSRFSQSGSTSEEHLTAYHAEVVPWLWLLSRTADCKMFQFMTPPDIIQMVFTTYGFKDFRLDLRGSYPIREYCVQYRETDLNFVSRLMEQYGIFYYFEHENGKHTMVLTDATVDKPCPFQGTARYQTTQGIAHAEEDVVTGFTWEQDFRSSKYSLMDWNFETPAVNLQVNVDSTQPPPAGMAFEIYDYPGEYVLRDVGENLAKVRIQEQDAQTVVVEGTSNIRTLTTGYSLGLTEHPRGSLNQRYLLTSIQHTATEGSYDSGDPMEAFTYSNHFRCMPLSLSFRPTRVTPRPVIQGLQTAIVAGTPGEEIYVDNYGRIKVQFHWDRIHTRNEESSCWIRVAQTWAGKRWGSVFIPRVGQEVLVGFLEGDPDQPMVVGTVYNGDQIHPYPLPDYKTRSVLRTDTTRGGGGANEIRFEDKAGYEEIMVHGQGELNIRVEADRHETIIGERHLQVYKDKHEDLGKNSYIGVKQDEIVHVGQDMSRKVDGNVVLKVGGSHTEDVGQEVYLKAGMKVVLEAGMQITLKAAGGFVDIGPSGVTIQGTMVLINSGGAAGSGTAQSPKALTKVIGVDPAGVGSPDFNVFFPTVIADTADGTGSAAVPPEVQPPDD